MTKDPSVCNWQERKRKEWNTRSFTAIGKRTRETGGSHYTSYHTKTLQEHWGIQRYILIAQTKKARLFLPTCSSHSNKHKSMPKDVSDLSRPAFILVRATSVVSGQRPSVCRQTFHTHILLSPTERYNWGVNRSRENAWNNTHRQVLGFFPPKNKVKEFTLANNASSTGWSVSCHVLYLSATSQNNLHIHFLPTLSMHE